MPGATVRREMLQTLEQLLSEVLELCSEGASRNAMGRAQGMLDGYMRAMMDAGIADQHELLLLVAKLRAEFCGPATNSSELRAEQWRALAAV